MDQARIEVGTELAAAAAEELVGLAQRQLEGQPDRLVIDLSAVAHFDSIGMGGLLEVMRRARDEQVEVKLRGAPAGVLEFLSLVSIDRLLRPPPPPEPRRDPITRLGAKVEPMLQAGGDVLRTTGAVVRELAAAPLRRRGLRLDRTIDELDAAAVGTLPVILLISFLLGLILAMQAYVQLRVWGAEIYMADMVGVSVVTEIGPLMTAIVLAARCGSSNAAQLGTMVVSEEIDALRQFGVRPLRYLVVPKVVALAITAVALGLVFDVVAICGGALFGLVRAGIELGAYQEQTRQALHLGELLVATVKSATFGTLVGIIGCSLGLRVSGGSVGVGKATTNAVVLSIFCIIILDALFVTVQRLVLA